MGLPKIMPHLAVGAIQTSLRKGLPSPVILLRGVLSGGGEDWASLGLYYPSGPWESRLSQPAAAENSRTDTSANGVARPPMERGHEPSTRRQPSQPSATATGNRASFRPVSAALLVLLRGYKLLISPWLPSACRFYPTCSCYMHDAIGTHGAGRGIYLGIRRLLKCHPWHPGGIDPVPLRPEPQRTELHGR